MSGETIRESCFFDVRGVLLVLSFCGVFFPRAICALLCFLLQNRCFYSVRPLLPFWAEHAFLALFQSCEGDGDVVGVVTPLRGVAQVVLHGVQVVEVAVLLRVHQDRGVEEDGEEQVEVEREESEVKERRSWMACGWNEVRLKNILSQ